MLTKIYVGIAIEHIACSILKQKSSKYVSSSKDHYTVHST